MKDRLLLTYEETADVLSISRTSVLRLTRKGDLRTIRIGRSVRIPRDQIDLLLGRLAGGSHE